MSPASTGLTCPKCHADMRSYERGGVTIDQCAECRGIFLDRGELDRLIDAEGSFYQPARVDDDRRRSDDDHHYRSDDDRYRSDDDRHRDHHYREQQHRRKRGGFLSDLFDD